MQDANVPGATARGTGSSPAGGLKITSHYWIQWAHVALDGLGLARRGRQAGELAVEVRGALSCVCSSVFAVEAFIAMLARLVKPQAVVDKWENSGGRRWTEGDQQARQCPELLGNRSEAGSRAPRRLGVLDRG